MKQNHRKLYCISCWRIRLESKAPRSLSFQFILSAYPFHNRGKEGRTMRYVLTICGLLGTVFTVYYILTCFGGMLRKRKSQAEYEDRIRIAVVVAARNEEAVIGDLVRSLKMQRYPSDLYDIYVIPNNCTDGTEQAARDAGARILRCTGRVSSKGEVLKQAFMQLTAMNHYDAYCVFDADNLVDPMFFHHVNNARQAGCHVAQGFRDSKNPFDSWVSGSMSVFYWFMSRFFNESRARLNLSCHLNGTGFMVSDALIRDIGWNTGTLTEDLEFTALCALRGYRIGWMPNARIYDEQPVRFRDSVVQRRRWTSGSLQCMRRYAKALIERKTAVSLDIGCLFLGNLLNYVGIILANFIRQYDSENRQPEFPYLCLLVSGGNSQIVRVDSPLQYEILGQTIDDAVGEAFDKCAKMMGLGYPGGPVVDRLAKTGNPDRFKFSKPHIQGYDYSFSGIKTSLLYFVRDMMAEDSEFMEKNKEDICASFQKALIDILMDKLIKAAKDTGIRQITIGGGVSANSGLRKRIEEEGRKRGWTTFLPEFKFTTDNAAMIAIAGWFHYQNGERSSLDVAPVSRLAEF